MSGTPRVITEPLGGSALARLAIAGQAPLAWYPRLPQSPAEWTKRAREVARGARNGWLAELSPAFDASGAAGERLARVARDGGVVVTTGQQPGLFGGPIYTWSKAISALELADAIQRNTGVPTAPVFWAATDDADFEEAATTWIAHAGGATELRITRAVPGARALPMAEMPLGGVRESFAALAAAAGSVVDPGVLDAARLAYHEEATVGGAYVQLLRVLLQPLGIAVIDASHRALLEAEHPLLVRALERAPAISAALADRSAELRAAGHVPQVADVDALSLVFGRVGGEKERVPVARAAAVAARASAERLSPNVLLRPVAERAVLPTVAYVAGPGEIAYFAQVRAVAESLGADAPMAVPRWSCTIVESHIDALMERYGASREELAHPDAIEGRLARATLPPQLLEDVDRLREAVNGATATLRERLADDPELLPARVVEGAARQMTWRADHLERRLVAGAKRREAALMRDIGTMRGALYPGGIRQERALNILPLLARHGPLLIESMRSCARAHAEALVTTGSPPRIEA